MKPLAEIDHTEDHADLVFHQSNLKTVFSKCSSTMKTILSRMIFSLKILNSTLKSRMPILRGERSSEDFGRRRSWEWNCWQRNVTWSLTLMGFGLKTWMTRWMVRCHCFLKNHNLLNPRRQGAIPGCSPWTSPVLPLIKVFLLVDNLPIIIHWCFILREENEGAGEEEERTRWRFWWMLFWQFLSCYPDQKLSF